MGGCQDPLFRRFLLGYVAEEGTPTLRPVPGIDLAGYRQAVVDRCSSAAVRDTVARLAVDGSERMTTWLLPEVRDNLATGGEGRRSAAVFAAWARYCEGVDEQGEPIDVVDRRRDALLERARRQREDPLTFLADRELFGDLVDDERFTSCYRTTLASLHEHARATLGGIVGALGRRRRRRSAASPDVGGAEAGVVGSGRTLARPGCPVATHRPGRTISADHALTGATRHGPE